MPLRLSGVMIIGIVPAGRRYFICLKNGVHITFQDWSIDTIRHNVCCVCPCILPCPVETIPNREYDSKVLIECKGGCYTMGPFIKPFTRYADSIPIYNFRSSNKKKKIQSLIPSKKFIVNGISFEMVAVNGGNFTMGERRMFRKNTTHEVFLSNYYIGKTEVTQALWKAVMGTNPSSFKGDKFPVEKISWYDCQEFVKKLNQLTGENFRLPTEAEWEFAACGGNQSKGYKYSGSNKIDEVAWCSNLFYNQTLPVATKYPNELGIYDMSGNVWEWCYDYYGKVPSDSLFKFSLNMDSARVIRGGSWCEDAKLNRVTYRSRCEPNQAEYNIGLRLCLSE